MRRAWRTDDGGAARGCWLRNQREAFQEFRETCGVSGNRNKSNNVAGTNHKWSKSIVRPQEGGGGEVKWTC